MARAIAVEIVGDASSVERAFSKASNSAKKFDKSVSSASRGVAAGSGIFRGFGRSLAFASGGFLTFAGVTSVIKSAIDGAENLRAAQEGLDVAIRHTGGNLKVLVPQYKAVAQGAARFGIDQADATTALQRATVLTGDAAKAQRAYEEALVISKATGKDFNSVLTATAKGQEGITTSLQRYGIELKKGTPGQQQFNFVMSRFAGQAKANTTASQRLSASLHNIRDNVGQALLPAFDKLANSLSNWLTKMNRSGKLERDVAAGMKTIHAVASPLIASLKQLSSAIGLVNQGWNKLSSLTSGHGIVASNLRNLGNAIKLGITNELFPLKSLTDLFGSHGAPGLVTSSTRRIGGAPGFFGDITSPHRRAAASSGPFGSAQPTSKQIQNFQLPTSLQIAQARAALTKTTNDDVAVAKKIVAFIKKLIDEGRLHGKALLAALQEEGSALSVIDSAQQQAADAAKAAAAKAREIAAKRKAREQAFLNNLIDPLKLEVQLSKDQAQGKSTVKDLKALRASAEKALRTGKLSLEQQKEAWDQIASLNQQIKDQLQTQSGPKFRQASTKALTAGLGLNAAQRKALRARLSQLGPGGTVPNPGVGAYGYAINPNTDRPIHVHTHVKLDGKKVGSSVTRHQQRHNRRNPTQRRGPNAATRG